MTSGALIHEIILQAPDAGQDSVGQPVTTWTTFATVRAHIRDANGRQFAAAQAMQNAVYAEITIRYLPGVTPAMRVLHGTDVYDIESILGQDRFWLTLMCSRGKGTDSGLVGGSGLVEKVVPVDADSFGLSDSESAGILRKFTWASLKAALVGIFAPSAKGVTNGDSHDHNGGDGAQIAYSSISGLPTLGNSAPLNVGTAAGTVAAGNDSRIVAATPAETTTTIGALINGATSDSSPVDADQIGIMDSTAANILKKLSWAALKTSLASIFATLAGKAGGQTINGGTAASESLTLQSTAHATKGNIVLGTASAYDQVNARLGVGTLTPGAKIHASSTTEQLRLGFDDSNFASTTVSATGLVTISGTLGQYIFAGPTDAQATATLGSELITNWTFASDLSGWTAGAGWSWAAGGALHTAGSTATLAQDESVVTGSTYQLDIAISGRTAGSITVALGSVGVIESGTSSVFTTTLSRTVVSGATGTVSLAITPTTDFNGTIDSVSLKLVTLGSFPAAMRFTEGGSAGTEIRQSIAMGNTSIGLNAGYSVTTGSNNSNFGRDAGRSITTSTSNSNFGINAGYSITTGSNNNTFGLNAGRYLADGTTALTTPSNCIYIGSSTKASAGGVTAENVFGYNAIGIGSNTTCIGASSNTKTQIYGDIILDKTVTAGGTTGAQTINKTVGSVNFAAAASSLVVTNSRVTTASVIIATVATNDTTLKSVVAVAASGSFTLTANAAATAEARVNFMVIN